MKKNKLIVLIISIVMVFAMTACQTGTAPTPLTPSSGTIDGFNYTISEYEPAKYQQEILEKRGFYIDYLDQTDSPAFVFISAGKTVSTNIKMNVSNIEVNNNSVTITIYETKGDATLKSNYPTVQVQLYPIPVSVTVVDTDGNILPQY